jgi:post-segregation antitoxin (ccd killing protein)
MKAKLTLSVDPEVLLEARKVAKEMKVSISALLEDYLRKFIRSKEDIKNYKPSNFLSQIPAKEPSYPYDDKSDDQWLEENLES